MVAMLSLAVSVFLISPTDGQLQQTGGVSLMQYEALAVDGLAEETDEQDACKSWCTVSQCGWKACKACSQCPQETETCRSFCAASAHCTWKTCKGCPYCQKETEGCKSWCDTHTSPWDEKCKLNPCKGCEPCPEPTPAMANCKPWCSPNTFPWQTKCKLDACKGCEPCPEPTPEETTADPETPTPTLAPTSAPTDAPTLAPTVQPTLAPTVAPTRSTPTWTGWVNSWDQPVDWTASSGYVMTGVHSKHDNGKEDRVWDFQQSKMLLSTQPVRTDFVNDWDGEFTYGDDSKVFVGMYSVHDNGKEDRRFKIDQSNLPPGVTAIGCHWTGETNWDAEWTLAGNSGEAITAMWSRHDNGKEDRVFKFRFCSLA